MLKTNHICFQKLILVLTISKDTQFFYHVLHIIKKNHYIFYFKPVKISYFKIAILIFKTILIFNN